MVVTFVKQTKNGKYYYTLHDYQVGLFGKYSLTLIWGPYMETGRRKLSHFETRRELDEKVREIVRRRFSQGYRILYSYSHSSEYRNLFRSGGLSGGAGDTAGTAANPFIIDGDYPDIMDDKGGSIGDKKAQG